MAKTGGITRGEQDKIHEDLTVILKELVRRIMEIKERKDQPDFNKALDEYCDFQEAIGAILRLTGYTQCQAINPDHPEYVAEKMGEMYKELKYLAGIVKDAGISARQLLADIERKE